MHTGRDLLERAALSRWTNIVVALCGPAGIEHGSTTKAVEVGNFGPGLRAANCHVWGLNQAYGWWLEGEAPGLVNCTAEGAEIAQVVVIGNDTQIVGGKYFGARAGSRLPPSRSESSGFRRRPERSSTRRS